MVYAVGPAVVLKLGGSLAETQRLPVIAEIVTRARYPVVVVPGGGMLADGVRTAQRDLKITDALAHRLALLSMHQMGLVIASRHPRFETVETLAGIAGALVNGAVPVWLPYELQSADDTIPADWTTTSDALAARLAERMGCGQVALVKSCPIPHGATLEWVRENDVADPVFSAIVERSRLKYELYGPGDDARLERRLQCQGTIAT